MHTDTLPTDTTLDEAFARLAHTGPERAGWLSNHAPMVAEALVARGHADDVHRWIDGYRDKLEDRPRGIARITADQWRDPLGDPVRTGDWLDFFARELAAGPWTEVLTRWWPRLLPGIAAGATHGVIRVGHAVRALRAAQTPERVAELGHGLAYWAARWQPLAAPGTGPYPVTDPRRALDRMPRVRRQQYGVRARLAQLADLPDWPTAAGAVPGDPAADAATRLRDIVRAAVRHFGEYGHGSPVMLVHAATAPTAVARCLPVLPAHLWGPSLSAAWAATAALTAAYAPAEGRPSPRNAAPSVADSLAAARAGGDPHAIKFADAAADLADEPAVRRILAYAVPLITED